MVSLGKPMLDQTTVPLMPWHSCSQLLTQHLFEWESRPNLNSGDVGNLFTPSASQTFLSQTSGTEAHASSSSSLVFFLLSAPSLNKDETPSPSLDVTQSSPYPSRRSFPALSIGGLTTSHGPCCKWLGGQALLTSRASAAAAR